MLLYEMFEDQQEPTFIDALRDFLPIAVKQLKLTSLPKIKLERNLEDTHVPTFGRFENDARIISLDIENRHPVDILRTLAHELTHYAQGERGELDDDSWHTGSSEENEANAMAGIVMRVFNTEHPQYLKMKPISLPTNQLDEGFMRNAALVATLASVLASGPAQADPQVTPAAKAIGIARTINRMKGYGPDAARAEAYQELNNLIRAMSGQGDNNSKIYPLIKDMIKTPGELPTDPEQLPPLTDEPMVNEKWSEKYKSSIDCDNPKGFSQRAHCQGRKKTDEDTCKTHESPSGRMTNMCPDDDDYEINYGQQANENFADGKNPGRKGLAKRMGVDCGQSVSKLRSIAKNSSGERQRMAHWCANMKSGRQA